MNILHNKVYAALNEKMDSNYNAGLMNFVIDKSYQCQLFIYY